MSYFCRYYKLCTAKTWRCYFKIKADRPNNLTIIYTYVQNQKTHTGKYAHFTGVLIFHYNIVNITSVQNMGNCKKRTVPSVQFTVSDWCSLVIWVMVQNIYNQFWNISFSFFFYFVARSHFQKLDADIHRVINHYSNLLGIYYISDN